ncbi:MAG TPA: membrane-bound PQQ-dependent dehydrogenase, glucose/quinate/shikimate family [Caldimonas sp.]|nr:membrane-bound PQQ-dependent dehydrogenase, glucose/quinate/shikimate family [Caldimonas sp.]
MAATATGWAMLVLGLLLAGGGVRLATLGGTWAYVGLGIGWLLTGAFLIGRRRAALWIYAALLAFTLVWALSEVGLDRWALAPRLALFWLVGLWLLSPWVSRLLSGRTSDRRVEVDVNPPAGPATPSALAADRRWRLTRAPWFAARAGLSAAALLVLAVGLISMTQDPFDVPGEMRGPLAAGTLPAAPTPAADDWTVYGGTPQGQRYSTLADITPGNVGDLKVAWTFHTGDKKRPDDPEETTAENVPLKVGDTLYLCSKHDHVIALDPATGQKRWEFDPKIEVSHDFQHLNCRGLAYHDATLAPAVAGHASVPALAAGASHPAGSAGVTVASANAATCRKRVILPSIDARLFALDAATGQPCAGFGDNGVVDLTVGIGEFRRGYYMETSPPVVTARLIVIGSSINDNESVDNPSGVIRAFDVADGHLVWSWDLGRADPNAPLAYGQTYTPNTPDAWAPPSVDEQLGIVYFPLGNLSPDQLGANRSPAVERFTSSVVALDLATGKLRWSFQGVHHDLWDRDMPAQPTLVDLEINGSKVPALVQPTKQGDVYVLDRRSGKPALPVEETAVPASTLPDEHVSPTQPRSALSFMPPRLTDKDMWGATPFDQLVCRIVFKSMDYQGPYTPPATHETLTYPSNLGVFDWGGVAVDPVRQALVGVPVHMAFTYQLVPRPGAEANVVTEGQKEHFNENYGAKYAIKSGPFLSPLGLPCQAPPWGAIASADLRTGKVNWMHRNGTTRDRMPSFLPIPFPMGMPGFGSPLVTAGGVVFYSGSLDNYLRAYEETSGRKLWEARLPGGGQATPMTYRADGKQYVVVSAGGHGAAGTDLSDAFVAYSLP